MKDWVIVKFENGAVKVWRDYGTAWGSPIYTVLEYVTGSHQDAIAAAQAHKCSLATTMPTPG